METLRREDGPGVEPAATSRRLDYLSSLDGLRAVAVLGVVAYHAEPDLVPGGFLGVDVFFVISGFLITSLLIKERASERRIDLRRFWRRRARRLGPAMLTVLTVVAVAGHTWTPTDQLDRLRGDGLATLGYVMNWRLIADGDRYFDTFVDPSPLRHMWSLAIEEQYYLAWPLLVAGVLARRRGFLGPLALGVGVASVAAMALVEGSLSRLYYGTDTRLHVVMTGCVLGVLADRRPAVVRRLTGAPSIALVATASAMVAMLVVTDDDAGFYPGGLVVFSLVAAVAVAGCARHGELPVLSNPLLVGIGKRSYGLYLWHWPVQVFLTDQRIGLGHVGSTVARLVVMAVLTGVSYRVVERPVRRSHAPLPRWWPLLPVAVGALMVVATLGGTTSEFGDAAPNEVRTVEADPGVEAPVAADGQQIASVVVVGDSVATSMEDGLASAFAAAGIDATLATHPGCGVTEGVALTDAGAVATFASSCAAQLDRQVEVITSVDPDLVLVVAHADSYPRRLADGTEIAPEDDPEAYLLLLSEAADRLGAGGAIVAFSLPAAVTVDEPGLTNDRIVVYRTLLHQLAEANDRVVLVAEDEVVCPDGVCIADLAGVELRPDGLHYTDASEHVIAPPLVAATLDALSDT